MIEQEIIPATGHNCSDTWTSNDTQHWHTCTICGDKADLQDHIIENRKCTICNTSFKFTQGLEYTLNSDKQSYSVRGIGTANDTDIIIPSKYEGLPVIYINNSAFKNCSGLTSVVIPDSITYIGYRAFYGCSGLTSITIPDSVTSIGEGAFSNCSKLKDINYNGTKAQWDAIEKGSSWDSGTGDYTIHCTDGDIKKG